MQPAERRVVAGVHSGRFDHESAENLNRQALTIRRRLLGDDDALVAESHDKLAHVLMGPQTEESLLIAMGLVEASEARP